MVDAMIGPHRGPTSPRATRRRSRHAPGPVLAASAVPGG